MFECISWPSNLVRPADYHVAHWSYSHYLWSLGLSCSSFSSWFSFMDTTLHIYYLCDLSHAFSLLLSTGTSSQFTAFSSTCYIANSSAIISQSGIVHVPELPLHASAHCTVCWCSFLVLIDSPFSSLTIQLASNVILYITVNILGTMSYFFYERQQRRAFLETCQSLEAKLVLEEESQKQVCILLFVKFIAMKWVDRICCWSRRVCLCHLLASLLASLSTFIANLTFNCSERERGNRKIECTQIDCLG